MVAVRFGVRILFPALSLAPLLCVLSPRLAFAGSKTEADEKAGAALFVDKGCTFCHGIGGAGTSKAPSLIDLRKDKAWPEAKIKNQIMNGGQKMPPFADSLTDQEVDQLIAYLLAKHRPAPTPNPPAQ
jgi:mono/diheme cytochrome c family protein